MESAGFGFQDGIHRTMPDVLHRTQPEADGGLAVGDVFDREVPAGGVHTGWKYGDAHAPAICHIQRHLVGVILGDGEQSGHVFFGIMALEIAGLYSDDAIIGGMALVEAVAGKLFPVVKDGVGGFLFNAALPLPRGRISPGACAAYP